MKTIYSAGVAGIGIELLNRSGFFFAPDDGAGNGGGAGSQGGAAADPVVAGVAASVKAGAAAADAENAAARASQAERDAEAGKEGAGGADDVNAWRRRHDQKEKDLKAANKELETFREEKKKRDEAELSESQKATKRAEEAETRAARAERNLMARDIAAETGLPHGATKFVTGDTEAEMRESAAALKELGVGAPKTGADIVDHAAAAASGAASAGGATKVGAATGAGARLADLPIDDQIAAAYKAGNSTEAIRLKRLKAGLGISRQS